MEINLKTLIFLFYIIPINSYINFPFKTRKPEIKNEEDFMRKMFHNDIYTNIKLGSHEETLPVNIKMHSLSFYIIDEKNNNTNNIKYYSSKSNLLKKEKELKKLYLYEEDYTHAFVVTDKIIFDKKNQINNFTFILTDSIISSYHITEGGVIGLEFVSYLKSQITDSLFIENLKKSKIINKSIFSIKYNSNDEGVFIVGDELHLTKESDYVENALKIIDCTEISNEIQWGFKIDNFTVNGNQIKGIYNILFYPEFNFIIGEEYYKDYIEENYFKNNKNCEKKEFTIIGKFESEYDKTYEYFVCNSNIKESDFPNIKILNKKMNLTFEFDSKELFIEYNNKKYFIVVFPEDLTFSTFIMGKPIFQKYDFIFNKESKKIGVYDKSVPRYNKIWDTIWSIFKIILIILFIFIIILIGYSIYIKLNGPRKKRANEIEDNYDYLPSTKSNSPLI